MLCSYERWNFSTENGRGNPTACGKAPQMYKVTTPWCIMEHDIFVHGGATEEKVPLDQKAACLLTDPCGISPSSHSTSPPTSQATCLTPEASTSGKPHILLSLDKHLDREQLHTKAMLVAKTPTDMRSNSENNRSGARSVSKRSLNNTDAETLRSEVERLQEVVCELRKASPSVAHLSDLALGREREDFEEKMRRALALLRKKDIKIRELGEAMAKRKSTSSLRSSMTGRSGDQDSGRLDTSSDGRYIDQPITDMVEHDSSLHCNGCNSNTSKESQSSRLEEYVRKQAGQNEALLEEIARLRSASNVIAESDGRGMSEDAGERPKQQSASADESQTISDINILLKSQYEGESIAENNCASRGRWGMSADEETAAVPTLRAQAALAAQEADISKRKAELEQTSEAWHREAQEARAREAALLAKVETLERLLEVARRTVLDREARLQDAHAKLNTWSHRRENNACTTASAEESETVPSGGEPVIVGARTLGGLQIPVDRRRDASAQEEMREFYGAQEWWLHLASIESGLSRENHSRITGECVRDVTFVERRREEARGEVSRLRSALYDQGLEVVTLRQRLLKVEMELRARAREKDESKVKAFQQAVEMDKAGRVHELTENAHIAELEGQVEVLRVQDSVSEALASARGELTAIKLDVIRAKGEAELSAQLLDDERQRLALALARAEDLQDKLDRLEVAKSLRGLSGGVKPLSLINHFAGTAFRQNQRIKALEAKVKSMHARCVQLVDLLRGGTVDSPLIENATSVAKLPRAASEHGQAQQRDAWLEVCIQEALAAMEAGRRRALEDEVGSLRVELLSYQQREGSIRHRPPAGVPDGNMENIRALRRELAQAHREIEALRVHVSDLRTRIQSRCSPQAWTGRVIGDDEGDGYMELRRPHTIYTLPMVAKDRSKEIGISGYHHDGDGNATAEVSRLKSVLLEKEAQVDVLSATVEALRGSVPCSPSGRGGAHEVHDGDRSSPIRPSTRKDRKESARSHLCTDKSGKKYEGCGMALPSEIGAQGLVRQCIYLTVRLNSEIAHAYGAERRQNRLSVELEHVEVEKLRAETAGAELAQRVRVLEVDVGKMRAALTAMQSESEARLRGAGEEASKLRNALHDAELGADDARKELHATRAEMHALEAELQVSREKFEREVRRVHEDHASKLKEYADRLDIGASISRSLAERPRRVGSEADIKVSPIAHAIQQLTKQWLSYVAEGDKYESVKDGPTMRSCLRRGQDNIGISSDQQKLVTKFLQDIATRLDEECCRAVRHARVLEWELRRVREDAIDATTALQEARVKHVRLYARLALAEAVINATSTSQSVRTVSVVDVSPLSMSKVNCSRDGFSGYVQNPGKGHISIKGDEWSVSCTTAALFLLEKRLAVAVADVVATEAARAAATAGEASATVRAEAAEAEIARNRAAADMVEAELERRKALATHEVKMEAKEWRRDIKTELERWWRDDLMQLHNGTRLDWDRVQNMEEAAADCTSSIRADVTPSTHNNDRDNRKYSENADSTRVDGVMQGIIAGRAEQAILQERLLAKDQCLSHARGEVRRLRSILERWLRDFVTPGTGMRQRRQPTTLVKPPSGKAFSQNDHLERKLLTATAELLSARDEVFTLRAETAALRELIAKVREDEREARETVDRRVKSARQISRRRVEDDSHDAAERLAHERERFKSQLGVAHANVLRLRAHVAELERRNEDLEAMQEGNRILRADKDYVPKLGGGGSSSDHRSVKCVDENRSGSKRTRRVHEQRKDGEESKSGDSKQRGRARTVTQEAEALRRMYDGLAGELRMALRAKQEAMEDREALLQEAVEARAEAEKVKLAHEGQEVALKKLGRLLELRREGFSPGVVDEEDDDRDGGLKTDTLANWGRSRGDGARFARAMVAATVTEADLSQRLQASAASEVELRHMLRRRDCLIEELRCEQAKTDRLTSSIGGFASLSIFSSLSGAEDCTIKQGMGVNGLAVEESAGVLGDKGISPSDRVLKEVQQTATILGLRLELAEATASGDATDASRRAAERLACRLIPPGDDHAVEGCWVCGHSSLPEGSLRRRSTRSVIASSRAPGASFLMPSADMEIKAAEAQENVDNEEVKPTVRASPSAEEVGIHSGAASRVAEGYDSPYYTFGSGGEHERGGDHGDEAHGIEACPAQPPACVTRASSQDLSSGVQSLGSPVTVRAEEESKDGSEEDHYLLSQSQSACDTAKSVWVEGARLLRMQMAALKEKSDRTEKLLDEERVEKRGLEEELLRLRSETIQQQQGVRPATAALEGRDVRGSSGEGRSVGYLPCGHSNSSNRLDSERAVREGGIYGADDVHHEETHTASNHSSISQSEYTEGSRSATSPSIQAKPPVEISACSFREVLRGTELALALKDQELRQLRDLRAKETLTTREELTTAMEAQRERIEILTEHVRQARGRVRVLARLRPSRALSTHCEHARRSKGINGERSHWTSTQLSADQLLSMLATADEEVFEAKSRAERAEYELRVRSAEMSAMRRIIVRTGVENPQPCEDYSDTIQGTCDSKDLTFAPCSTSRVSGNDLSAIACVARLACAEAEIERLRDQGLAASQDVLEAQRDASALRLAASRSRLASEGAGRDREKKLQRQVYFLKRELNKVHDPTEALPSAGSKRLKTSSGETSNEAATDIALSRARAQSVEARKHSERRSRTIATLRTAKVSLEKELGRWRQKAEEAQAKLNRALRDITVRGNAVKALRNKVYSLETEIEILRGESVERNPCNRPTEADGTSNPAVSGNEVGDGCKQMRDEDTVYASMRELKAERDRLRVSSRQRRTSLSIKSAELSKRMREVERLEEHARELRAIVARKDAANHVLKTQLITLREEHENSRASSHRWKADAETKLRYLEQVRQSSIKEARMCRQSKGATTRELAALKSAFHSFIGMLWDDLRSRPTSIVDFATSAHQKIQRDDADVRTRDAEREGISTYSTESGCATRTKVSTAEDYDTSTYTPAGSLARVDSRRDGCFAELTKAEVSDIMMALNPVPPTSSGVTSITSSTVDVQAGEALTWAILAQSLSQDASRQARELELDDATFSARVEAALGGFDTSKILGDMLRSMHWQGRQNRDLGADGQLMQALAPRTPPTTSLPTAFTAPFQILSPSSSPATMLVRASNADTNYDNESPRRALDHAPSRYSRFLSTASLLGTDQQH